MAYLLQARRNARYRTEIFSLLSREEAKGFVGFIARANGWLLVAAGALFIATKETFELVEHNQWPTWIFWVLWLMMAGIAVGYTTARVIRSHRILDSTRPPEGPSTASE